MQTNKQKQTTLITQIPSSFILCKRIDEDLIQNKLLTQEHVDKKYLSTTEYVETRVVFPQLLVQ